MLNLIFGCLAIREIFTGELENVIYFVLCSGIADFFDGFIARLLKVSSPIGKDLDSLVDMVSFGLVPAFTLWAMIRSIDHGSILAYIPFSIALMSAYRLAKFNNDERQRDAFYGLPTPANALFCCALPLLVEKDIFSSALLSTEILAVISIVMSYLLVMNIRLIALKFKHFGWRENELRYLIFCLALVSLATFQLIALPFLIMFYVIASIFTNILSAK